MSKHLATFPNGIVGRWRVTLFLVLASMAVLFPLLLALSASFKSIGEMFSTPLRLVPVQPTLHAWKGLFSHIPAWRWLINSMFVSFLGTALNLVISAPAGYIFARFSFPGRNILYRAVVSTLMLPLAAYLVPLYLVTSRLHLINTYWGMAMPISESVLGVFLLTQFFRSIPREMEEAAVVDGCNTVQTFALVFLPMARASLITLAIFSFIWKWNMFLWPLMIINNRDLYPLTIGVSVTFSNDISWANMLMAGAVLIAAPVALLYLVFQRYIVGGEVLSGIK